MIVSRASLSLLTLIGAISITQGQTNQYLTREDSDPQALILLDKLEAQLKKSQLQIEFDMTISYPSEEPIKQDGSLIQQDDMYRIKTDDAEIWCNGTLRWIYMKQANEVNLYSAKDGEVLGPISLVAEFTGDQYVAIVSGDEKIRSIDVKVVELKPVDRESEIAKVKTFLQSDGKPVRIEVIEKNGSRSNMDIFKISVPEKRPETYFTFNKSDYPGVHIEDLRID